MPDWMLIDRNQLGRHLHDADVNLHAAAGRLSTRGRERTERDVDMAAEWVGQALKHLDFKWAFRIMVREDAPDELAAYELERERRDSGIFRRSLRMGVIAKRTGRHSWKGAAWWHAQESLAS